MSRSWDGLETHFPNISVSSRSRWNVGTSRSRLGLKVKRLGLVSVSSLRVSFTSDIFLMLKENWMISLQSNSFPSLLNFRSKYLKVAFKPLTNIRQITIQTMVHRPWPIVCVVLCSSQLGIQETQLPQRKSASAIGWLMDRAIYWTTQ